MAENAGGRGSLYNGGVGIQGGFGGTSTEYSTWSNLMSAILADADNGVGGFDHSPKIYVYTGPDVTLGETERVNIQGLHRKTIFFSAGQTISRGEIRFWEFEDIIIRNWKRRGPYYPWGGGASGDGTAKEQSYFVFNEGNGYWVDHCDMDAEFQMGGPNTQEFPDGMIDTNLSDFWVVSNCRIWNGARGMLVGYSNTETANIGKLNGTFRNNWVKNLAGRGPKCRYGKIDIYNNYYTNIPSWFDDWSPEEKPNGQHFPAHGAGAELWMRSNYCEDGQSLVRDDDDGNDTSGVIFENNFIGNYQYTGGTVSKRAYNVTWDPKTEPGYDIPVPLMTPTESKVYTEKWAGANYHLIRELTTNVNNASFGSITELSTGIYKAGDTAQVSATPEPGYKFDGFTSADVADSTANPYSFTMPSDDVTIQAVFSVIKYGLTLSVNPSGLGTLSQSPASPHPEGTIVALTATPGSGNQFDGWYDGANLLSTANPYNYTMPGTDKTITGQFSEVSPTTYDLTLAIDPAGYGTASQSPAGPHATGTTVELTAVPDSGKVFVGWYDGATLLSNLNPYNYTTTGSDKTITANFALIERNLNIGVNNTFGSISVSPSPPYYVGTIITVSASPNSGYQFDNFTSLVIADSTENPYTFAMPDQDASITANFSEYQSYFIVRKKILV